MDICSGGARIQKRSFLAHHSCMLYGMTCFVSTALSFWEGKLTFSNHGCVKREGTFRLRPRGRSSWRQKEAINPVPTIIWELSRTFLVENY